MKIFIVGAGLIGKERIRALQCLNQKYKSIDLVAVIDPIFKKKSEVINGIKYDTFSSLKEAYVKFKNKIDWVFICSPHSETHHLAKLSLDNNSNIMVEKPLGTNIIEYNNIVKNVSFNQKIKVGFNYRFFKGVNKLIQDTLERKFGDIISVNLILAHGNSPGMEKSWKLNPKYSGGGCLLDPGIHLIDIAMLLSKNSLKLKSYQDWRGFWNTGIEEEIFFLAKDSSNTIYNFNISLNRWRSEFKIQVNGTDGYGIVSGRGRSYGNQKYVTGKRWGWSDSKTQSESEELVVDNYAANDSFLVETELILFKDNDHLESDLNNIKTANHLDNKNCLEFIDSFNLKIKT